MKIDTTNLQDYKELESMLLSINTDCPRAGRLSTCNVLFALYALLEKNNLQKAKQHFDVCGLLDTFCVINHQDRMFDYKISSICYAMLSDNLPFLKDIYANLTYNIFYLDNDTREKIPLSMDEMVENGEGAIFVHTIQQFLKNNAELIERNINLIETKYFKLYPKDKESMIYDLEFYKALFQKDKKSCETILQEMVTPKIHKMRNCESLFRKYVSMPALGYAKLAWICDVEVGVKSKLIPKKLLPIQPNESYEIPYDFLKKIK
jgi:hypothetical protein